MYEKCKKSVWREKFCLCGPFLCSVILTKVTYSPIKESEMGKVNMIMTMKWDGAGNLS